MVLQGILIGVVAGVVVSAYRYMIHSAEEVSQTMYAFARGNWLIAFGVVALLVVMGIFVGWLTKKFPLIKGSGIPQIEGQIHGLFTASWWKIIIAKMIGGTISIIAGLSLGREGPSIQLGAAAGEGISNAFKRDNTEQKYLITCGASAGLAAAFNAPLAGMLFALEEVHKNFSVGVMLSTLTSAITADIVSKIFFGMNTVFGSNTLTELPLNAYIFLPFLGAILGLGGWFYNKTLLWSQKMYKKISFIKGPFVMIIPFLVAGVAGLLMPDILGGGGRIIASLIANKYAISYMIILLVAKFVFSMISFGSGAPGGIFFPLLVLGALVGGIFGYISINYFGLADTYLLNFILLGMVGMFTGIVRAPITGIVLIVEMSGSITQMLALSVVALFAYFVADLMKSKPIYDSLLNNIRPNKIVNDEHSESVLIDFPVEFGSSVDGTAVSKIGWDKQFLIVSVLRGETEIIPQGDTIIKGGDVIKILCPSKLEDEFREDVGSRFNI